MLKVGINLLNLNNRKLSLFLPSSYLGGGNAEVLADVTAQISHRRKLKPVRNIGKRQCAVAQQTGDLQSRVPVYPISRAITADTLACLRQISRGDT